MVFDIISSVIDIALLYLYLNLFLSSPKKQLPKSLVFSCFLFVEIILYNANRLLISNQTMAKPLLLITIGCLTTVILTYLYPYCTFRNRLFVSVSFQLICGLGEMLTYFFLSICFPHTAALISDIQLSFISQFCIWFFCFLFRQLWHKKYKSQSVSYNLLIILTPFLSFIILIVIIQCFLSSGNAIADAYYITVLICLLSLNIVNYYLLDNVIQVATLKEKERELSKQVDFQTTKYQQLSSAYRNTRSLLHDTKKHFFYIQNCIEAQHYTDVISYIQNALDHLEQNYSRINTGNLVIDAFVSNYMTIAQNENIQFDTKIQIIPSRIPTDDYDLCIIIGNLLDNSLNATRGIPSPHPRKIYTELFTTKLEFIIHIKNTCQPKLKSSPASQSTHELYHGYGLTNVRSLVKKYDGTYSCFTKDYTFETIIVIPIKSSDALPVSNLV